MGRLNHVHVIEAVTNSESQLARDQFLDTFYYFRFLSRRRSIHDNCVCLHEVLPEIDKGCDILLNNRQTETRNEHFVWIIVRSFNELFKFFDSCIDFLGRININLELILIFLPRRDQAARKSNLAGSFSHVACQHPHFNSCFSKIGDTLCNFVLEIIFESCTANDIQIRFQKSYI